MVDSVLKVDDLCIKGRFQGHGRVQGVSKSDEFCSKNEKLCIKNEKFCIRNDEFCIKNDELCRKDDEFKREVMKDLLKSDFAALANEQFPEINGAVAKADGERYF